MYLFVRRQPSEELVFVLLTAVFLEARTVPGSEQLTQDVCSVGSQVSREGVCEASGLYMPV